ncbi:hypothetical protein [Leptolyngbya sp. PCC 6406]|nr:hypothetical protein [Leptolyngbya sp. PCC 6406]
MVAALDREAQQLGVQREAIIKLWLSERLQARATEVPPALPRGWKS